MTGHRAPDGVPAGWRVVNLDAVDSTNEDARRRALARDPGRLWVVAREQLAGRGRRGRSWASPPGNLYASALLIDPCPPALGPQLGFVGGVALARAAHDVGASDARLKWPNDLVVDGAKCAGLLVEGVSLPENRAAYIVGVGVNCASAPQGVGYPVTTLDDEAIDPRTLFARLALRFDEALTQWRAGTAFAEILDAWLAYAAGHGTRISIADGAGRREGIFEGLDADGRLLFRGASGIEIIESADLWIMPRSDDAPDAAQSAVIRGNTGS